MSGIRPIAALCGGAAALFLFALASANAAQRPPYRFIVQVSDPSGAPISGAQVAVSSRDGRVHESQTSDAGGRAALEPPFAGAYLLHVEAAGFARVIRPIDVPVATGGVAVQMRLAALAERVVVTGSSHVQTAAEVSKAVTAVDRAEIDARHEFLVADALRTVPGVTVQQLGGVGAFTSIRLRGLRERDTAILMDGVRVRDAASPQGDAAALIGDLSTANLDRIEVLRGSGSSLYGSHAIGGVVHLITHPGAGRSRGDAAVELGGLGFRRAVGRLRGGALNERVAYSLAASQAAVASGPDGNDDARTLTIHGRADVRLPAAARATVRAYASDAESALNDAPEAIGPLPTVGFVRADPQSTFVPSPDDPDSRRQASFASTLVRYEQRVSPGVGYTLSFHRLATDRRFRDGPLGRSLFEPAAPDASRFAGTIHTLDGRLNREWNTRQTSTFGYELERERYESRAEPGIPTLAWGAHLSQQSHAVYAQHELRFDALDVSVGARAQRFALHRADFAPPDRAPFGAASLVAPPAAVTGDVAMAYRFTRLGTKVRGHVGNAYRAPTMFERTGASFGSGGYMVFGDPRLPPERSVAVDVGVDQQLFGRRALVSTTWFHTSLRNVIAFGSLDAHNDPFGRTSGYRSADGRVARGVELSARIQPSIDLEVGVAYTFADADAPAGDLDGLPRAAAVPAHQLSALVTHRAGRLQWSFEVEAAGAHYVTLFDPVSFGSRAYRFQGIAKADLVAGYAVVPARARLFAVIENLFDRRYFVQGFRTAGRTGRVGLAVFF